MLVSCSANAEATCHLLSSKILQRTAICTGLFGRATLPAQARILCSLEEKTDGRGDRHEGVSHVFQPHEGLKIRFGEIEIPYTELAGAVTLRLNDTLGSHVLCLYAGTSGDFEGLSEENLEAFRAHMEVPEQCREMGPHVVLIHDVTEFQNRLIEASKREGFHAMHAGSVQYYDDDIYSGEIPQPGFWKPRRFAWQRERRFLFETRGRMSDPGRLDVGSLSDIAAIVDASALKGGFRFDLPDE
jgi:hypothetical protein